MCESDNPWSIPDLVSIIEGWNCPPWLNVIIAGDGQDVRDYVNVGIIPHDDTLPGSLSFKCYRDSPLRDVFHHLDIMTIMREREFGEFDYGPLLRMDLLIAEMRYLKMVGRVERNIAVRREITKTGGRRKGVGIVAGVLGWLGVL